MHQLRLDDACLPVGRPSAGGPIWLALGIALLIYLAGPINLSVLRAEQQPSATPAASPSRQPPSTAEDHHVWLINHHIQQAWDAHGLAASPPASDREWCRRVYLDLIGRIPKVEELEEFLRVRGADRRSALINRLLGDEYLEEYARNWATLWTNILIGRTGGTGNDSLASRAGMQQYLRRAFQKNKPYDQIVHELITAVGSCRPGDEDFNGAANFLVDKMDEGGIQATAKTAQIFLGMAVQCMQCHDHPFNDGHLYKQNRFWELNAFFRQTATESLEGMDRRRVGRVVQRDFAGEGRSRHWKSANEVVWEQIEGELVDTEAPQRAAAPIFFELRNGKVRIAYPTFVDGSSLASLLEERGSPFGNSGYLEHVDRREELADLVTASDRLEAAIVNRMWAHFFGHGLTKPFDDIGPHNPPTHPELLDELAAALRQSSFDLKQLKRWIVLSKPYSLSSRQTRGNQKDDPTLGAQPMFSHFYLRQMQAEQLYESLLVATAADMTLTSDDRQRTKQRWLDQFNTAFGTDENDEATTFNGSIPQALMLMNGDLIRKATGTENGSLLAKVAGDTSMTNLNKIRHLYLAAVARPPTRQELMICNKLLTARRGNVAAALQDIWWALLNSNEFILIH